MQSVKNSVSPNLSQATLSSSSGKVEINTLTKIKQKQSTKQRAKVKTQKLQKNQQTITSALNKVKRKNDSKENTPPTASHDNILQINGTELINDICGNSTDSDVLSDATVNSKRSSRVNKGVKKQDNNWIYSRKSPAKRQCSKSTDSDTDLVVKAIQSDMEECLENGDGDKELGVEKSNGEILLENNNLEEVLPPIEKSTKDEDR